VCGSSFICLRGSERSVVLVFGERDSMSRAWVQLANMYLVNASSVLIAHSSTPFVSQHINQNACNTASFCRHTSEFISIPCCACLIA